MIDFLKEYIKKNERVLFLLFLASVFIGALIVNL